MAQMVRKQIYIPKRLDALLKRAAKQRRITPAQLIRAAIDRELKDAATRPFVPDHAAWEKAYQFMLSRQASAPGDGEPYRWRREDAYEERLSRYDKPKQSTTG